MRLYHRTEHPEAIVAERFRGSAGGDWVKGVWFGSSLEASLAGHGEWVVVVEIPDGVALAYRRVEEGVAYDDLVFMPAEVVNAYPRKVYPSPREEPGRYLPRASDA